MVQLRCFAADVHLHHPPVQERQDRLCCASSGSSAPIFSISYLEAHTLFLLRVATSFIKQVLTAKLGSMLHG